MKLGREKTCEETETLLFNTGLLFLLFYLTSKEVEGRGSMGRTLAAAYLEIH